MEHDGKETDDDDSHSTADGAGFDRKTLGDAPREEEASGTTGESIDVATEDERHLVDEDVADDTSGSTSEHAHDVGGPEWKTCIERLLDTYNGEESEANGVEEKDGA